LCWLAPEEKFLPGKEVKSCQGDISSGGKLIAKKTQEEENLQLTQRGEVRMRKGNLPRGKERGPRRWPGVEREGPFPRLGKSKGETKSSSFQEVCRRAKSITGGGKTRGDSDAILLKKDKKEPSPKNTRRKRRGDPARKKMLALLSEETKPSSDASKEVFISPTARATRRVAKNKCKKVLGGGEGRAPEEKQEDMMGKTNALLGGGVVSCANEKDAQEENPGSVDQARKIETRVGWRATTHGGTRG